VWLSKSHKESRLWSRFPSQYFSLLPSSWAGSGKLTEFAKVNGGKIVAKAKMPERTGFKERLCEMQRWETALAVFAQLT